MTTPVRYSIDARYLHIPQFFAWGLSKIIEVYNTFATSGVMRQLSAVERAPSLPSPLILNAPPGGASPLSSPSSSYIAQLPSSPLKGRIYRICTAPGGYGAYQLLARKTASLGEGTKGRVWQVETPTHKSIAAMKICKKPPDREVELLKHAQEMGVPNIVRFEDYVSLVDEDGSPAYGLRTNLLGKDTFAMFLESRCEVHVDSILKWAENMLTTLQCLHGIGIAHLDIKPENLSVDRETKKMILLDFGFARWIKKIVKGDYVGTMSYHAPEQLLHEDYNGSVDVWALAVTLFFLYVGYPLVPAALLNNPTQEFADCLHLMEAIIGPPPNGSFFQDTPSRRHLFKNGAALPLSEESNASLELYSRIEKHFPEHPIWQGLILLSAKEKKDDKDKVDKLIALFSEMLRYEDRITAAEAMERFFEKSAESKREVE